MSDCRFDPASGDLRLDGRCLDRIARLAAGYDVASDDLKDLERAGIAPSGVLDPRLVPLGRCLASPGVRLRVDHDGASSWHIEGWLDDKLTVLLRSAAGDEPSGPGDVVAVPRSMTAFRLAHVLKLGPRPRVKVTEPVEIDDGLLEALLVPGEGWTLAAIESLLPEGDEILPEWLEILGALADRPCARWRAGVWWNARDESPAARLLEVIESDAGSFLITRSRRPDRPFRRARLHPLTATHIWRLLCALLPPADAVDEPLGGVGERSPES